MEEFIAAINEITTRQDNVLIIILIYLLNLLFLLKLFILSYTHSHTHPYTHSCTHSYKHSLFPKISVSKNVQKCKIKMQRKSNGMECQVRDSPGSSPLVDSSNGGSKFKPQAIVIDMVDFWSIFMKPRAK